MADVGSKCSVAKNVFFLFVPFWRLEVVKRKLEEAEAREEALLRRITENEKTLNKMRWVVLDFSYNLAENIKK